MTAVNATQTRFGYPDTLVRAYRHWSVQVRPEQVTLGSLVLVCTDPARAFSEIRAGAFAELQQVTHDVEATLKAAWGWQKINYLMLMMSDPDVHFHVFPRYDAPRSFGGLEFPDRSWPKAPDIFTPTRPPPETIQALTAELRRRWPAG